MRDLGENITKFTRGKKQKEKGVSSTQIEEILGKEETGDLGTGGGKEPSLPRNGEKLDACLIKRVGGKKEEAGRLS